MGRHCAVLGYSLTELVAVIGCTDSGNRSFLPELLSSELCLVSISADYEPIPGISVVNNGLMLPPMRLS